MACALAATPAAGAGRTRVLYLMGTVARVEVAARTRAAADGAAEAAVRALERAERDLSTWRGGTPLAALNAAPPGRLVPLPPRVAGELRRAVEVARRTGGAFDPVLGALSAAWGLRGAGHDPSPDELLAAVEATGWRWLEVGPGWARRLHADATVEEGGWGKGAALDRAVAAARRAGADRVLVDLGGQLAAWGAPLEVAVAHPDRREQSVARLRLPEGSVATSGDGVRAVRRGGRRIGHLLDPRTGRPALDFGSVTVWAPSALEADALATALFVMGPEAGLRWAREEGGVEVLYLLRCGGGVEAVFTPGLAGHLELREDVVPRRAVVPARSGQ